MEVFINKTITHPDIKMIWNFFPFDFIIWGPIKWTLNVLGFFFWLPAWPFYEMWNVIPYTFMMGLWFISFLAVCILGALLFTMSAVWVFIVYMYVTALPDLITFPIILIIIGLIVFLIVLFVYMIIAAA